MNEIILNQVKNFFASVLGIDQNEIQNDSSIFQLGIDSVMMITVVNEFNNKFGTELSLSDITFKHNTIELISEYLDSKKANSIGKIQVKNSVITHKSEEQDSTENGSEFDSADTEDINHMINNNIDSMDSDVFFKVCQQQNEAMENIFNKQLDVLKRLPYTNNKKTNSANTCSDNSITSKKTNDLENINNSTDIVEENNVAVVPAKIALTEKQSTMLNHLIASLSEKTKKSKELAETFRPYLADLDETAGFNMLLKEIHYQISSEYCHGSEMIDIDGNKYIDIAMGFGSVILGHSPEFVVDAIKKEVDRGVQLAPRHRLVGEVAKLVCELTGFERTCFTVTGTEAVMTAMKIARAYKKRDKIGIFNGCYHGHNDSTLITRINKGGELQLLASGISKFAVRDMVLLDYNDDSSLQEIIKRKDELAAVIIEPVQSRRPEIQPVEFLKKLRKVTEENNILLIFDEIITGFRCNIGGAKRLFGYLW